MSAILDRIPTTKPYAAWLAEHPDNQRVLDHLLEREDAAGGPGGYGNDFVDRVEPAPPASF